MVEITILAKPSAITDAVVLLKGGVIWQSIENNPVSTMNARVNVTWVAKLTTKGCASTVLRINQELKLYLVIKNTKPTSLNM